MQRNFFFLIPPSILCIFIPACIPSDVHCPSLCSCSDRRVDCISLGLKSPPSSIPSDALSFNISGNQLVMLQTNFAGNVEHLLYFNASHNQIASIEADTFISMSSVRVIDLSNNRLTSLDATNLRGLSKLVEIDLSFNRLSSIDTAFDATTSLSRLDLRNNKLHVISQYSLKGLNNMRHLVLSANKIERIEQAAFKDLDKLLYLVLKNNRLHSLNRLDHLSKSLSYLDLSECQLTKIPRGLTSGLRYLQLRRNNISELNQDSFADCSNLNILLLDENKINSIEKDTFSKMSQLQQLWLNDNKLEMLPKNLPVSLQRLLVDANKITEITDDLFSDKAHLTSFSLVGNDINKISPSAFAKLSNLATLDLSSNRIKRLPANLFKENSKIVNLVLNRNPLNFLNSIGELPSLQELALSFVETDLNNLSPSFFENIKNLVKLDLDSSPTVIQALINQVENSLVFEHLKELGFMGSGLTGLRRSFVDHLPSLNYLRLSSGKWHCDEEILWMNDWFKTSGVKVETVEDIRCFSPRKLHGKQVGNILESDLENVVTTLSGDNHKNGNKISDFEGNGKKKSTKISDFILLKSSTEFQHARLQTTQPSIYTSNGLKHSSKSLPHYKAVSNFIMVSPLIENDAYLLNLNDEERLQIEKQKQITGSALQQEATKEATGKFGYVIIAIVIIVTAVVAMLIIILIVVTWKRKSIPPPPKQHDNASPATVIKYKNKNGVLYFSTAQPGNGQANNNDDVVTVNDVSVPADYSSRCSGSLRKINLSENGGSRTRVYKWEET